MNDEKNEAKISEVFLSYQGEGPFAGSRQLFVRFYGCNQDCIYCDTPLESYRTFSKEALLSKVLDFEDDYNEIVLTGGEPLLHSGFIREFLFLFGKHRKHKVYLETNGTLPEELSKIIDYMDIISMDFKLPSSSGRDIDLWEVHEKFAEISSGKELIIKAVITDSTTMEDIKKMGSIISGLKGPCTIVLQPVTPINDSIKEADEEMMAFFKGYLWKETRKEIMILGQVHKVLGVR